LIPGVLDDGLPVGPFRRLGLWALAVRASEELGADALARWAYRCAMAEARPTHPRWRSRLVEPLSGVTVSVVVGKGPAS
jgi:hypothetical protein